MARSILFLSSNGVGLGHLTRQLAVATRLPAEFRPVFHTMATAAQLVRAAGFPALFHQHHLAAGVAVPDWNTALGQELLALAEGLDPAAIVVDSTAIFGGYVTLLQKWAHRPRLWLRRPMWQDSNRHFLDHAGLFSDVIEPGELAAELDCGPTVGQPAHRVHPVLLISPHQRQPRAVAQRLLGAVGNRPLVALQLGHVYGARTADLRQRLCAVLARMAVQVVDFRSPLEPPGADVGPEARMLYPSYALSTGFDALITPSGYNSFHESLLGGVPTLFLPQAGPGMDRQDLRALWAQARGGALSLGADAPAVEMADAVEQLLSPGFAQGMAEAGLARGWTNGAFEIARLLAQSVEP